MNVLPGREIHHGVRAPLDRPEELLHFFRNPGAHGGVTDIRVDLREEVAADYHRFRFRVIDVRGKHGAALGDLLPDKFPGHGFRHLHFKRGPRGLREENPAGAGRDRVKALHVSRAVLILADRGEFHFRGHDPGSGVVELRDFFPGFRGEHRTGAVEAVGER